MNLDHLQLFPNQLMDGDPQECVGLTISDIWGNYTGIPRDPDFSYAQYFRLTKETPTTAGEDVYKSIQAAVAFGCLPASLDTTTALMNGDLYVANPDNYTKEQKAAALSRPPKGIKQFFSFGQIEDWLNTKQIGVALAMKWYPEFSHPINGDLPMPTSDHFTWHCVAVYQSVGEKLMIKPWLGSDYGHGGYGYINRDVLLKTMWGAYSFDPDAWRWLSLAGIALSNLKAIPELLPQMAANPKV